MWRPAVACKVHRHVSAVWEGRHRGEPSSPYTESLSSSFMCLLKTFLCIYLYLDSSSSYCMHLRWWEATISAENLWLPGHLPDQGQGQLMSCRFQTSSTLQLLRPLLLGTLSALEKGFFFCLCPDLCLTIKCYCGGLRSGSWTSWPSLCLWPF